MASIENREVLKRIEKDCFVSPAAEQVPKQLSNTVVPVVIANPERISSVFKNATRTTTGTTTIYSTPSNKEFYLTALTLSWATNAANDATSAYIQFTLDDGSTGNYLVLAKVTLTATQQNITLSLPYPLKIKSGTSIICGSTFAAGTSRVEASIFGYTVNPQ